MTTNDALLFVGYEEDTGTVLSVAGVAVLGIRGAYSPPIHAARRTTGPTMAESPAARVLKCAGKVWKSVPPMKEEWGDALLICSMNECGVGWIMGAPLPLDLKSAFKALILARGLGEKAVWSLPIAQAAYDAVCTHHPMAIKQVPVAPSNPANVEPFEKSLTQLFNAKPPRPDDVAPGSASSSMFNLAIRGW